MSSDSLMDSTADLLADVSLGSDLPNSDASMEEPNLFPCDREDCDFVGETENSLKDHKKGVHQTVAKLKNSRGQSTCI
ncbi:MAG TPA: hypothetical protein DCE78_02660 [Bacteroidetes bacterium]|nr:hypothetical protein [Bacteroidota bacterium]